MEVAVSDTKTGIYKALALAQAAMGPVLKDATNPAFKRGNDPLKYATLQSVLDACMPALSANGIAVMQPPCEVDGKHCVKTIFAHESGETVECVVPLIVAKNDMQGYGSAVTYARRYGLMAMAGIAPEDDDGNAAAAAAPREDRRPAGPTQADIDAAVSAIGAATTGKALLAAIPGPLADLPPVRAAIIDTLRIIVKGAQSTKALDAMADAFRPVWPEVEADAKARADELRGEAPF